MLELRELRDDGFDGADDVALDDEVQIRDLARLHLREQVLERRTARALRRELLATEPLGAALREIACGALVVDDARHFARGRRLVEAEDLDGIARACPVELLALVVVERAHLAVRVARDDGVADLERAALHEHRRDRAAADVESRLDDRAGGLGVRIRAQVELGVGDEEDALEQIVEVFLLLRRHARDLCRASPLLGLEPVGGEVGEHAVGICVGQVDLVDGDDDRHVRGAGVRDRLFRLRHHAVVCGDDEDGDVGHLRAAGAHRGERLVARRVEERHLAPVHVDLVRADVLRDPAGLGVDDVRLADRVEQRRLAVIDVAHDRDDRGPRLERLFRIVERLGLFLFLARVLDRHLALELGRDQLDLFVGQRLRRRPHLAEVHENLDDVRHRDAERLRVVAHADARLDGDGTGRRRRRLAGAVAARRVVAAAASLARVARARSLVVDDDPAPAITRTTTAARAERTIRFASVSHSPPQCKDVRVPDRPGRTVVVPAQTPVAPAPARSRRGAGRCTRHAPALPGRRRARRRGR